MTTRTLDGWLSTKKSDKEVARSSKFAKETRKKKHQPSGRAVKGTGKKAVGRNGKTTSTRGRKRNDSYDEDGDDEDHDFIDDEDDQDEDESSESEEEAFNSEIEEDVDEDEELLIHDDESDDNDSGNDVEVEVTRTASSSRSSRAATRNPRRRLEQNDAFHVDSDADSDDVDVDSDSDSEGDSLLPARKIRPSAPSKLLKSNANAAKRRFNPSLEAHSASVIIRSKKKMKRSAEPLMRFEPPAMKKVMAKSKYGNSNDDDDDDDEELTSPLFTPKRMSIRSKPKSKLEYEEIFSSDEENNKRLRIDNKNINRKNQAGEKSRYFQKQKSRFRDTITLDDSENTDDSDNDNDDKKTKSNGTSVKYNNYFLEDSPEPRDGDKKRWMNKTIRKIDMEDTNNSNCQKKASRVAYRINDSSDEDEVVHIDHGNEDDHFDEDTKIAMRLSLKDTNKKKKNGEKGAANRKKKTPIDDDETDGEMNIETILDDSSDEEEEDQGDEYYDQEKETATNVLRSAEKLSGHVVRAMSGWFQNKNNNGSVQGIIMDGAIALGNLDESKSGLNDNGDEQSNDKKINGNANNNNHRWISQSVMAKACPDVTLSPYQLVGVNWMALLNGMTCEVGTKGTKNVNGVLADEMGLGKTVQTIAFLAWLKYRRQSQTKEQKLPPLPHLIVVPVSTLPNWIREFEKFCPDLNVIKYHGSLKEREAMKEDLREHLPKYRSEHSMPRTPLDVIVASVSYFQKENSPDRKFLSNFNYDYLVVDEAHNLKNAKSTRYKMLDKVKTKHRLLLTGTPVQNNPQELLNMLSFIMPLFSKAGASFEEKDNYTEQMLKHFVDDKVENEDEQSAYKKLKQLFAPFVLRRKKDDVISQLLPKKERKTIFVELSKSTRSIYESIITSHFEKNKRTINPGTGEHLFTNLRKCAHHPLLLRNRWNSKEAKKQLTEDFYRFGAFKGEGCTKQRVGEEIESWNDFNIHLTALDLIDENHHRREHLQRYVLEQNDLFCSSKFESLRDLLPDLIMDGHRILVFSSWTSCLDLLGCLMQHLGIQFQRMDGSTSSDERQRLIDQFNSDKSYSVFLLSTKACGLGINLTSADTCIIHDLDFNPFNDLQAEDRCHRIGQKKPVTVYKLITMNSVDEDIFKMQEKKAKMNAAIMDSSSSRKEKNAILKSVLDRASLTRDDNEETIL